MAIFNIFSWLLVPVRGLAWPIVKGWVRSSFPAVEQISTTALASRMEQGEPLLLIDARQLEEYEVSHLPGACRATSVDEVAALSSDQDLPVVVYCSIGYRSARLVESLVASGYGAVNLEGSLFQWANENRLLVSAGKQTHRVHSYSPAWGLLLSSADSTDSIDSVDLTDV